MEIILFKKKKKYNLIKQIKKFCSLIFQPKNLFQIPSAYYTYILFHHWTFYSDFKLRIFFEFKPTYTYEKSMRRSINYYQQMNIKDIKNFSWLSGDKIF